MSVIDTILELQSTYYKRHKRAVSMLCVNKQTYNNFLKELDVDYINNLHGMQIVINSRTSLKLV